MTEDEAYTLGDQDGFDDGFDGIQIYNSFNANVPPQLRSVYRSAYQRGYDDGVEAYRRMIENR